MIAAARERIKTFIDVFVTRRGNDPRVVHALDNDKELLTADIRELLDATAWHTGNPDIPKGKEREFIVAVRRKHRSEPFVFPATYANEFTDDDGLSTRDGGAYVANGWHLTGLDMSGEFNNVYEPLALNDGDEVVGWQALPKWSEPA